MKNLNLNTAHTSWLPIINHAMTKMDPHYIENLTKNPNWLPGPDKIFNAFSLPLDNLSYILFGESPYPRAASANGYAFWDNQVQGLWSAEGLSTKVNRATSLRNFIKMLLVAQQALSADNVTQHAIAQLNKTHLVTNIHELFSNIQEQGILLLNASLVLSEQPVKEDAKQWRPFMNAILHTLNEMQKDHIVLLLWGKIANLIISLDSSRHFKHFMAEHPYNLTFITNVDVINFFKPMNLLRRA